ncbi:MAG: penicillin-binding protein 1C [Treponema sp.]|jgi:penicillin-binding protein 1C|nr:penicillin-binding protein 1C [Treponema sp.]
MSRFIKLAAAIFVCLFVVNIFLRLVPYPELAAYQGRSCGFTVLDRNGRTLRAFPAPDGVKREWTALKTIPAAALRVFVRAEDSRFYLHCGVDPLAVAGAAFRNWRAGRTVSGASTITMQLARLVKPRRQGLRGKISEAFDALRLEARLSKRQILELWINGIPFGSNIEGLGAVSRARFGRDVTRLDDSRAALLAVIPRRPGLYDPAFNPEAAVNAALVLSRRCRLRLDEAALRDAAAETAPGHAAAAKNPFYAPHFTERSAQAAGEHSGAIVSTLDLDLQIYAERRLSAEITQLEHNRVSNGAILAVDNASGAVLVYAGSASWFDEESSGKIDGVRVENQPGSCLKPFLYALALENGFSPNDILPDIPTVFGSSEAYSPANFNRRFNGPVRFRLALASSLNVPAVYLLERLGVRAFEDYLVKLKFESIARSRGSNGAGLALGNAEVSLEELVRAFSVFPRGGRAMNLRFTESPPSGKKLAETDQQVIPAYSAWLITDILSDRASRFTGFGPAPALATEFPSIFKTGTANQFQHIWALGATPRFTVGVWMGNFSGETVVGRTGSSIPARITADLLKALEQSMPVSSTPQFPAAPGSVIETEICALSGMAATSACAGSLRERLPPERIPAPCSWHRGPGREPVFPAEYQAWLTERFHQGRTGFLPSAGGAYIRLPVSGSVFYADSALPPEAQAIRVETAGFGPEALVYANDALQGSLNQAGVFVLPLHRGRFNIRIEDESGSSAAVNIEVR